VTLYCSFCCLTEEKLQRLLIANLFCLSRIVESKSQPSTDDLFWVSYGFESIPITQTQRPKKTGPKESDSLTQTQTPKNVWVLKGIRKKLGFVWFPQQFGF